LANIQLKVPKYGITWAKLGKSAINLFIDKDAGLSITQITHITSISKGSTHTILKNLLKVRRITLRSIPHLLTSDLKKQVKCARKLLKMFHKYDKSRFSNIVMKAGFTIFAPVRKCNKKILATKDVRRLDIAIAFSIIEKYT
jgi:hypothetical protein